MFAFGRLTEPGMPNFSKKKTSKLSHQLFEKRSSGFRKQIAKQQSEEGGMDGGELCSVCEEYIAEWFCRKCDRKICQVGMFLA